MTLTGWPVPGTLTTSYTDRLASTRDPDSFPGGTLTVSRVGHFKGKSMKNDPDRLAGTGDPDSFPGGTLTVSRVGHFKGKSMKNDPDRSAGTGDPDNFLY
eukprot:EG_transcript_21545